MIRFLWKMISVILVLFAVAGCTVHEDKNIFQMARIDQAEIVRIEISRAGEKVELTEEEKLSTILQLMASAVPALDAGSTRMTMDGDYVIDMYTGAGAGPYRFYYNSEKQWLFFARKAKKYHPFKCVSLLHPLEKLFEIDSYRGVISEQEGLPSYLTLSGRMDDHKFYGMRGDTFSVWDTAKLTTELLLTNVWSFAISPDKNKLAYTNQKGLNIFDLKTLQSINVVKAGKKPAVVSPEPVCWSPNGAELLYAVEHEWNSDFYVLDIETGQSRMFEFKTVRNFLSKPVAWLKNGNILFLVSSAQSKSGEREYMPAGYRSNLMQADPEGNLRAVTNVKDYNYITFAGLTENEEEALVVIHDTSSGGRKAAVVTLPEGEIEYLPWDGPVISASVSPDGRFVAAALPLEQAPRGYRLELLDRNAGKVIFHFKNNDYVAEHNFLWYPDSKKFIYLDRCLENALNNKLRQVLILPE